MKLRLLLLSLLILNSVIFLCSCGVFGKELTSAGNHQMRVDVINKQYKDCLASAQTAADSSACESKRDDDLGKEDQRYDEEKQVLEEIRLCQECQTSILERWGYKKDAKKIAKKLASKRSTQGFSFDCEEAISELIRNNCIDQVAIRKFKYSLPKFGLSSLDATKIVNQYYSEGVYAKSKRQTTKNMKDDCLINNRFGDEIEVTKKLLIDMGLLDEDGDGDDPPSAQVPDPDPVDDPNVPPIKIDNPGGQNPTSDEYSLEVNEISKIVISNYGYLKYKLTNDQKIELDKIASFMNRWPDAKVTIVGHTCSIGNHDDNLRLGLRRAHQAKLYLISQGVDESRIFENSMAAESPCANNDTEEGRLLNRRITFIFK